MCCVVILGVCFVPDGGAWAGRELADWYPWGQMSTNGAGDAENIVRSSPGVTKDEGYTGRGLDK